MNYSVKFNKQAIQEFNDLRPAFKEQILKKLKEIACYPIRPKNRVRSIKNGYKIKFKQIGYRLIYKLEKA